MGLQEEIDKTRAEIRTDGYPVSIGEWISIYEKEELDIHPEFQRFFRWSTRQKSRLIERLARRHLRKGVQPFLSLLAHRRTRAPVVQRRVCDHTREIISEVLAARGVDREQYTDAGDFMKDADHFNNEMSTAMAVTKDLLTGVGGSHAAASSSMDLFASYIKKVQDRLLNPPPKPRSKKGRSFRKELRQILDRHNALQNPELVKAAREMLTLLRYRQAG